MPQNKSAVNAPPETTLQTIKRNITPDPEMDTSKRAYGEGHEWDSGDSPAQEGVQQWKDTFGSPLERAHGHLKQLLDTFGKHLDSDVLDKFNESLEGMARDLSQAADVGHTSKGVPLNQNTRALFGAASGIVNFLPATKKISDSLMVTPEHSTELDKKFAQLKGHRIISRPASPVVSEVKPAASQTPPQPKAQLKPQPKTVLPQKVLARATQELGPSPAEQ